MADILLSGKASTVPHGTVAPLVVVVSLDVVVILYWIRGYGMRAGGPCRLGSVSKRWQRSGTSPLEDRS